MQDPLRVCRLSEALKEFPEMTVVCAKVAALTCPTANATSGGVTRDTQTTVAEHAQKDDLPPSELKLSERADLLGWYSQLSDHAGRNEIARQSRALRDISGCAFVDSSMASVERSPKRRSVAYVKFTASTSTMVSQRPQLGCHSRKTVDRGRACKKRGISPLRFALVERS